jgi:hypothetical protein
MSDDDIQTGIKEAEVAAKELRGFKDTGCSPPYAGQDVDWMKVPTSHGTYVVPIIQPKDRRCPWLIESGVLPPEVAAEYEVVTVPIKFLLHKAGPRP